MFKYISFLNKTYSHSIFQSSNFSRFKDIKRRSKLSLFTNPCIFLIVLIHRNISKCLSLAIRQLTQKMRFINKSFIFIVRNRYDLFHGILKGHSVNIPKKTSSLSLNRSRSWSIKQQSQLTKSSISGIQFLPNFTIYLNTKFSFMQNEKATSIITLTHQILPFINFAKIKTLK